MNNLDNLKTEFDEMSIKYSENFPTSSITSFKTGGLAKICVSPNNLGELVQIISIIKHNNLKFELIGRGSNVLFSDYGYDGVIIRTEKLNSFEIIHKDNLLSSFVIAQCGLSLTYLSKEAANASLSGIEFAYGIPGSVGGAVFMNAGAYGGQMSDVVIESIYLDTKTCQIHLLSAEEHKFGYRKSFFLEKLLSHDERYICLSTTLKLIHGNKTDIFDKMNSFMIARKEKQPLEFPSAGSVFKRHSRFYMGQIIEECGLKGYSIGDAQVSVKHAGFIINKGNATASDIIKLIEFIKNIINNKYGFLPECEIRIIT